MKTGIGDAVGGTPTPATGTVAVPGRWEKAVGIQAFYRISAGFNRITTGFYRIILGFYRLLLRITASYRINFFSQAMGPIRRMGRMSEVLCPLRVQNAVARNCAGKITDFSAMFHDFPRFYAQIRAVVTRFYAFLRVGPFLTTDGHEGTRIQEGDNL